jgi:ABC-type lipoprotein release transport system permease subunit
MRYLLDVGGTGLASVLQYPVRSAVTVAVLVAVLSPYLVGTGLAEGLEAEAEASARFGADLSVTGSQFGRPAPVPLEAVGRVARLDGVTAVVPRIVGGLVLGTEHVPAVLVGLPPGGFPAWAACVEGELPHAGRGNELVLGAALARRLHLHVGSVLPPFYHNDRGERLSRVVGLFKADAPLWQAHLMLTSLETAAAVFDQPGLATDLLVWCRPGAEEVLARAIPREVGLPRPEGRGAVRLRVTAREELLARLPRGVLRRQGMFTLHFALIFVAGVLVLLVTAGLGQAERRREIGILKATGWQTDEVLLRGLVESLALGTAAACLALLLAWLWLRVGNGCGLTDFFLDGDEAPDFAVPFRLTPVPFLLAFVLSFGLVLGGTLYSTWRAAVVAPREALR